MATHVLSAPTLISALMPSGGGTLASGDTIELSGHDLIIDTDAVSYPVTLSNAGATAHMELRDGGRIGLNATLPTSICPWVDPEHPLPVSDESKAIDGDPYRTALTANARAEIKLNGTFSLGGGPASLPTATREGNFWALLLSSSATNSLTFDRDLPLHPGDVLFNVSIQTNNAYNTVTVTAYDSASRTATIDNTSATRTVGHLWGLIAGGVLILLTGSLDNPRISAPTTAGTLNILGYSSSTNNSYAIGTTSTIIADRIAFKAQNNASSINIYGSGLLGENACVIARQVVADPLCASKYSAPKYICVSECATWRQQANYADVFVSKGGFVYNLTCARLIKNTKIVNLGIAGSRFGFIRAVSCTIQNEAVSDTQFENSGTVSRVARSSFPVDTDLPDAFYHAPATAADVPWRYEDYWVRKGETLRIACRAMRGGDDAKARVAIGEMAVWVPAEGMPTLAEWRCEGGQALEWQGGQIAWTNNTGEDCQVRVWTMATGLLGAYLRTWRATGGAL